MEENKEQELIAQYLESEYGNSTEPTYEEIPIPLQLEGIVDEDNEGLIPYDVDKFKKGVKDYSYIAGAFSALRNSGMSEQSVMNWLLGEVEIKGLTKQLETQERMNQVQAETSLKTEV